MKERGLWEVNALFFFANYDNKFLTINFHLNMKYNRDIRYNMKLKVSWPLLSQILCLFQFLSLPWKNLSNFLRAVLEKFAVNIYRHTLRFRTFFGNLKPFKYDEKWFYFTLKALFNHNIFKFLFWIFSHDKNGLIRKIVRRYNPVNKQLQYVYFPISQELYFPIINFSRIIFPIIFPNISQSVNEIWSWETFFLKNHTQYVVGNYSQALS